MSGATQRPYHRSIAAGLMVVLCALPARAACTGDCNADGAVGVDELVTLVSIALGDTAATACAAGDVSQDGQITIDEIVAAVDHALRGCPSAVVTLQAAVHFDLLQEAINPQLIGTVQPAPLADANRLLETSVHPASIRIDTGFENSGCPDGTVSGSLYDAATNTFNYCQLDRRLQQARASGATPLVIIDYTPLALGDPACVASNGHGRGAQLCPPADLDKYGALVEAMVEHVYADFGVTDFEVWNEPDGFFFAGTLSDYLNIYKACNDAVGHAEANLGLPVRTIHLGGPSGTSANRTWITALLAAAVAQSDLRVDFLSWHNYPNHTLGPRADPNLYAGTYYDDTVKVRGWLAPYQDQRSDLRPLLWINEWNANAFFDYRADTAYDAAFMTAALHGMQDAGLERSDRYNTWDSTPATPAGFNGNWGLFTYDGDVRPAFFSFAFWHQLAPTRVAVELLDTASQARAAASRTRYTQNLLASIDPGTGTATLLLYNFVPYNVADTGPPYCGGGVAMSATLQIDGLAAGDYQMTMQQIDCSTVIQPVATAGVARTVTTRSITDGTSLATMVPPAGVVLVTLEKN